MRVDAHLHSLGTGSSVREIIRDMDAAGVDRGVLVERSDRPDEAFTELLDAFPDRLRGVTVLRNLQSPPNLAKVHGRVQGVRLFSLGDTTTEHLSSLPEWPLLTQMADLEMKLWVYPSSRELALLDRIAASLPQLRIVLNHLGLSPLDRSKRRRNPGWLERRATILEGIASDRPNIHLVLSGHYAFSDHQFPYPDLVDLTRSLYASFGPDRLMVGSDYPWTKNRPGYAESLSVTERHLSDVDDKMASVLGGNALRLFDW